MTTIVKVSSASSREAASAALRAAGIPVVVVEEWSQAAEAARDHEGALLVCDAAAAGEAASAQGIPRDAARKLSHDLRTPLSAMAGWIHLLESGKLDEAGVKRALGKLQGNIDDQVRTIEKMLGSGTPNQETADK